MHDINEDEEEWVLELPPLGDLTADEAPNAADGLSDEDLGADLIASVSAGEQVGLDDSVGFDDEAPLFSLDLPPAEVVDDANVDAIPLIDQVDFGSEYGWTDDDEAGGEMPWDAEAVDLPVLSPLGTDATRGEAGVEEDFDDLGDGDDDAVPNLPPLRGALDEDEEDEELDLGFLTEPILGRPAETVEEPARPPLSSRHALLIAGPIRDVVTHDELWSVGPKGLFRGAELVVTTGLEGTAISLAGDMHGAGLLVGTERGGFRSADAQTFEAMPSLGTSAVRFVADPKGGVWALGASGRLQRSVDGGVTWSPPLLLTRIVAMATPGAGIVTLSAPKSARPQLAASTDGRRWTASEVPALERPDDDGGYVMAALAESVVLASSADAGKAHLSIDRGRTWRSLEGLPPIRALVLRHEPELVMYFAHESESGTAIVRFLPSRPTESDVIFEGVARTWALALDGENVVLAATDGGLVRIVIGETA